MARARNPAKGDPATAVSFKEKEPSASDRRRLFFYGLIPLGIN